MKWFLLGAALLLASCASTPRVGQSPGVQVIQNAALPAPNRTDLTQAARPYLVGPFDKLSIDVFGVQDLQQKEVQTDAGGRFSFPLIGVVEASGRTPEEVETEIEKRLTRFVRDPQVTVNLKETVSQVVTIDGQVAKPGMYPVLGNMTLIRAVATAGGVSELARLDDVVVFRQANGQRYAALYDLAAIRRGNYEDPEIFANDVVVVGDSSARRLFRDLLSVVPALASPLVILLTN